jgi:hypothetical protein
MEKWKSIKGTKYLVSDQGRVMNKKGKILKTPLNTYGYPTAYLWTDGRAQACLLHRLVAIAFIPNPDQKPEVNHKDGNKLNSKRSNLEWNTRRENIDHAVKEGLYKRGEGSHFAKLTKEDVIQIRSLEGITTQKALGEMYGISQQTVAKIFNRKNWKHI